MKEQGRGQDDECENCHGDWSDDVYTGVQGKPGADSVHREARLALDGRACAKVAHLGPAHYTRFERASWSRAFLCLVTLQPLRPSRGDSVPGTQLAGRQPGWDTGTSASATASALWLLRRSHGGRLWIRCADVRTRLLRTPALADGDRDAGGVSPAVERELSRHLHSVVLPAFSGTLRAYGDTSPADCREPGAAAQSVLDRLRTQDAAL